MSLFEDFADAAKAGPEKSLNFYIENYKSINNLLGDKLKTKGEIEFANEKTNNDRLLISLIMNDVTSISLPRGGKLSMTMLQPQAAINTFGSLDLKVNIPLNPSPEFISALNSGKFLPTFVMSSSAVSKEILRKVEPLVRSGRVLPRPFRGLTYFERELPQGNRKWAVSIADPNSPPDVWHLETRLSPAESTMKIVKGVKSDNSGGEFFDVMVPFIRGVKLNDLDKILQDEHDIICDFRLAIKDAVRVALDKNATTDEIVNDVLRPKVAKIERRFKYITNMGRIKVGAATVGTATMGLIAAQNSGAAAMISTVMGASGAALIVKEAIGAYENKASLRDEGFYLLWRITRKQ